MWVFCLHAMLLKYLYLWWKRYYWKVGGEGDKLKLLQSIMYCLMNFTQISSLLCRWRLAASEAENKTNISWDKKPVMMKFSSHQKQLNTEWHGAWKETHLMMGRSNLAKSAHKQIHNTYLTHLNTCALTNKTDVMQAAIIICKMETTDFPLSQQNIDIFCTVFSAHQLFWLEQTLEYSLEYNKIIASQS